MTTTFSSANARAECIYTAASANRNSHVVDWTILEEGISEVAYASDRNVAIARNIGDIHRQPTRLIATPNEILTVLKFAHPRYSNAKPKIIAASEDGYLYLFTYHVTNSELSSEWQLHQEWQASPKQSQTQKKPAGFPARKAKAEPSASIRALGVLRKDPSQVEKSQNTNDEILFASATSDGMLQVWSVKGNAEVELVQTISLGRSRAETRTEVLPLDIAITPLPGTVNALLLAVSGTDSKIDLFLAEDGRTFTRLFSLLGHTDWVRSIDFCRSGKEDEPWVMLASGAQDHGIRLWRIEQSDDNQQVVHTPVKEEERDEFDKMASEIEDGEDEAMATKMQTFRCEAKKWSISFDALLIGHEHWVTGLRWAPASLEGQPAALLSSSADNSVILWTPSSGVGKAIAGIDLPLFDEAETKKRIDSKEQDVWVALQRFGELGNVGSAANGMYGCAWDPTIRPSSTQQATLAHGYGGAVHIWSRHEENGRAQPWLPQPGLGGHFGAATTVRWEPGGQYILTGGLDKTTRLHGCYREGDKHSWHEMARPQTHGYEITALSWLSRLAFASAGDEKVIRVFEAPRGFVQSAQNLNMLPKEQSANLLIVYIPDLAHLIKPGKIANCIKEATKKSLRKGRLNIVVVSPLFDDVQHGKSPQASFEQVQAFLKWCYAMSWGPAVEADQLLFDVDVLLMGSQSAQVKLTQVQKPDELFVVNDKDFKPPFETYNASQLETGSDEESGIDASTSPDEPSSFQQHEAIALGGTFDHLHVGHKILLSMGCLLATRRIVVGVTGESMLAKKKHAELLESIQTRLDRVALFMNAFCNAIGRTELFHDIVILKDVAGPPGSDPNITALLFTDETVGGADFIDKERTKRDLKVLDRFTIGVIGASGETDVKGKDASELAAAKVGSTAIRGWIEKNKVKVKPTPASLEKVPTLNGDPRPVGASVPPLGLSNRAIFDPRDGQQGDPLDGPSATGQPIGSAIRSISTKLQRPPVEEELHNHSLWSEVSKLYGHSLELAALDVDVESGLVASSCKASHAEHAGIRLHDSRQGWRERQVLMGHSLNVTRVRFSPNGQKLVSVSRDRSWRLFARKQAEEGKESTDEVFEQVAEGQEAHSRIIYDVAWCGNDEFATASRDGNVKLWDAGVKEIRKDALPITTLSFKEPITAISAIDEKVLAVGSENGHVWLYQRAGQSDWAAILKIPNLHADALNELAWQPIHDGKRAILASAGQDRAVRLTEFQL
ncbi:WD40 repeat-like protein [Meira miltonrushii]|uniref:Elongator complex protein 2 n=1 Tax=Meira miltonrushii TaxID=1280837 RepID=A0A316VI82_9BASI|nr:WD40 repeat-like protein [Meira miltonrushii]PWN35711.1 WD40 repeat-like protein [Meira miltonrushii]